MTFIPNIAPDHLGLYVHIPFCARKCRYCDFASGPLRDPALADRYLDALAREAAARRVDRPVGSVYLGGGTPTMLSPAQLERLWMIVETFPRLPDAEVTLEANPGTLTPAHAALVARLPITRVSLGAQSFDAKELRTLGRIHSPEAVAESVAILRAAGTCRLSLDLMYGLPGQTAASWDESLAQALALRPEHLSAYALIVEEETPLSAEIAAGILVLPGEEEEDAMAAVLAARLAEGGYRLYEVSNAARPGAVSRHNLGYWLGREYLGLGAAAASMQGGVRWRNTADVDGYIERTASGGAAVEYAERLSAPSRLLERVMLGLRLCDGFPLAEAEATCGCGLREVAGTALDALLDDGMLDIRDGRLRLSAAGFPLANHVMTKLMANEGRRI